MENDIIKKHADSQVVLENFWVRLIQIIKQINPSLSEIQRNHHLKSDLRLDSLSLVQLAVKVQTEFSVDLAESFENGKNLETVGDILECLNV